MKKLYISIIAILLCLATACAAVPQQPDVFDDEGMNTISPVADIAPDSAADVTESPLEPADVSFPTDTAKPAESTAAPAVGGFVPCEHTLMVGHKVIGDELHSVPAALILYVGSEKFQEFVEKHEENPKTKASCGLPATILEFIDYFDISKEEFDDINDKYLKSSDDYNTEVLYAGLEAADAYYSSDRLQPALQREILFTLKLCLRMDVEDHEAFSGWYNGKLSALESKWGEKILPQIGLPGNYYSLPEIIATFDIPREKIEEMYEQTTSGVSGEALETTLDLDAIFKAAEEMKRSGVPASDVPAELDLTFFVPKK